MAGKCRRARPRRICAPCGAIISTARWSAQGIDVRYDPRTLKEQGIDRDAQIHIGPKAQALEEKGYHFDSQDRIRGERSIPYTLFDQASRAAHNAQIIEANKQKEGAAQGPQSNPAAKSREGEEFRRMMESKAPKTREDHEKRQLREAQAKARKAMSGSSSATATRSGWRRNRRNSSTINGRGSFTPPRARPPMTRSRNNTPPNG